MVYVESSGCDSAGAFVDGFINFQAPNPQQTPYFACNTSQVAVGYKAASNCLALTTFQVKHIFLWATHKVLR